MCAVRTLHTLPHCKPSSDSAAWDCSLTLQHWKQSKVVQIQFDLDVWHLLKQSCTPSFLPGEAAPQQCCSDRKVGCVPSGLGGHLPGWPLQESVVPFCSKLLPATPKGLRIEQFPRPQQQALAELWYIALLKETSLTWYLLQTKALVSNSRLAQINLHLGNVELNH